LAIKEIRVYPDPVLKQVAEPVVEVDEEARSLARDLIDTMRHHDHCVGLAANQIGVARRCVVVDITDHPKARSQAGLVVLFNPKIESSDGEEVGREGCLSIPELTGNVKRATEIVVSGLDLEGQGHQLRADAFEARALQHEIDHLDGILFLDRVASLRTDVFRRKI
jgi:peptide deformylase